MLNETHYRAVLNFFYFLLLDEAMALSASFRAIKKIQKKMKKKPVPDIDKVLISVSASVYELYRTHKQTVPSAPPKSDWKIPRQEYLIAWKEFMRRAEPQFSVALVLNYILKYKPKIIAEALELPEGTINFRLGRGLESLAQSSVIKTLVSK